MAAARHDRAGLVAVLRAEAATVHPGRSTVQLDRASLTLPRRGVSLSSRRIDLDTAAETAVGEGEVVLSGEGARIEGARFRARLSEEELVLEGGVHGRASLLGASR